MGRRECRVLVVDDDAETRLALRAVLETAGYEVQEATDGNTALELLRTGPPDLILLDAEMPGKDGWDVLREMGSGRPNLSHVPVVMFTGLSDDAHEQRARDLGAAAYVAKPVAAEDLRRVVARVISRHEASGVDRES